MYLNTLFHFLLRLNFNFVLFLRSFPVLAPETNDGIITPVIRLPSPSTPEFVDTPILDDAFITKDLETLMLVSMALLLLALDIPFPLLPSKENRSSFNELSILPDELRRGDSIGVSYSIPYCLFCGFIRSTKQRRLRLLFPISSLTLDEGTLIGFANITSLCLGSTILSNGSGVSYEKKDLYNLNKLCRMFQSYHDEEFRAYQSLETNDLYEFVCGPTSTLKVESSA